MPRRIDFARELADAIETQATDDFQARYRHVSLLVLDDVHRLASREAVQEELICVLDALADIGGRVVLTAAAAPEQLTGFLPRLAKPHGVGACRATCPARSGGPNGSLATVGPGRTLALRPAGP